MRLAPPILVLAVFLGACAGVGVRPDGGSVIGRSAAAVIAPSGGLVDLPGVATVIFPPGAFEAPQEVEVRTTTEKETAEGFQVTAELAEVRERLSYEVRVKTGRVAPSAKIGVVLAVPDSLLRSLPPGGDVEAYVQFLHASDYELLDHFYAVASTYDESAKTVQFTLPRAAFTDGRRSDGTFEAIATLAVGPRTAGGPVAAGRHRQVSSEEEGRRLGQ